MSKTIFWMCLAVLVSVPASVPAIASPFDDAQAAAKAGRYQDVVSILTDALAQGKLAPGERVAALSNRGVAYSLLGDYDDARKDLAQALDIDPADKLSMNQMGLIAQRVDHDDPAAANWYAKAAAAGYAPSQANLANLYRQGEGVTADDKKALELYQAAVDQQYVMACAPLGEMYMDGIGTHPNARLAVELFKQAADAGIAQGQYDLGLAYQQGLGVDQDAALAAQQYRAAAMQGHGEAQNSLGFLYRLGEGVPQDFEAAAKWYRLAADQGIVSAMNRLAWLMATCPVRTVCNGPGAVSLAVAAAKVHPIPTYMDTLAAAYARDGRFDLAIQTVKKVLAAIPADDPDRSTYEERLARYQKRKPIQL